VGGRRVVSERAARSLGATYLGERRTAFRVWAPRAQRVELVLSSPLDRTVPLDREGSGYHAAVVDGVEPGAGYVFRLDGRLKRPDPASRSQPFGVHSPSEVVAPLRMPPDTGFVNRPLPEHVIYELHVGTFTPEGTFDAIIPHIAALRDLGVTAIELMPITQFPGRRNWGYDGTYPFAVEVSYGGRSGLARLVDACHRGGLAVILDVVYNHLGPEGNYLADFGPYFTDAYRTPWGAAVNFDGAESDEVRRYFLDNATEWVRDLHVDALRVDAVHAIVDPSARPFVEELAEAVHAEGRRLGRRVYVIGECDRNDPRLVRSRERGGLGFDAQWNDDFHHALHALLTGERDGYYADFGSAAQLAKAYREAFVYTGERSPFRGRRHGAPARDVPAERFVVFSQNHDQVGNRMMGDRLSGTLWLPGLKVAAVALLLSPFVPLLFMGQEYGETAPFLYFVSHGDKALVEAVRRGRRAEFAAFAALGEPPDPADERTFLRSKLDHGLKRAGHHEALLELYRELLRLRRESPALATSDADGIEAVAFERARALYVRRWSEGAEVAFVLAFGTTGASVTPPLPAGRWRRILDTEEARWLGRGSSAPEIIESDGDIALSVAARSAVVYSRSREG